MQVGPILSGDGSSPEVCEERPIPKSLTPQALDRFIKEASGAKSSSGSFPPLIEKSPSVTGSFWNYLQTQNSNPWPERFLQTASAAPVHPTLEGYEKMIDLAERDCHYAEHLRGKIEIPWILCHSPLSTPEEKALAEWTQRQVTQIESDLAREGFTACDFSQKIQLAKRLFEALVRPVDQGGLGIEFDWEDRVSQRDLTAILKDHLAACSEFVILYLWVADRAGIPAVPLELFRDQGGGYPEHLKIGIKNPKSDRVEKMIDLYNSYFGEPVEGETWAEISRLQLLAYYYNLKGIQETDLAKGEKHVDFALELKPTNYVILFNKAYYQAHKGDLMGAKELLLKSIEDYPLYPKAYRNLSIIADELKEPALVEWALQRYGELSSDSKPF